MEYSWRFTVVARLLTDFSRDGTADRTRALLPWLNVVRTWVLAGIPYSLGLLACPSGWHWISIAVFVSHSTLSTPGAGQWRKVTAVQMDRCLHRSVLPAFTDEGRQLVMQHFSPDWLDLILSMASTQSECISTFCEANCLCFSRTLTFWRRNYFFFNFSTSCI